jgi:hypothetical protein
MKILVKGRSQTYLMYRKGKTQTYVNDRKGKE